MGEEGTCKNVFRILAESADDGKRGRGKGAKWANLKNALVPAIIFSYIRAGRTRAGQFHPRAGAPDSEEPMSNEPDKIIYSMIRVSKRHGQREVLKDISLSYF